MPTKYKIIFGFICMMAILVVVSVLGYRYLSLSLTAFNEYRRTAQVNVKLSDTEADYYVAGDNANRFLATYNNDFMEAAQVALDKFEEDIIAAERLMRRQENKALA